MTLSSRLRAAAALCAICALWQPADATEFPSVSAQTAANNPLDFAYFQQKLSVFGHWLRHPVWGDVWQPSIGSSFRPYFYGYWQLTTDYGWLWVSSEPYGHIVYHYGRWAFDPHFGWIWVPGYVWGPSWVAWRETDGYLGWLPMPPGYQDFSYGDATPLYGPSNLYGYQYFYGQPFALDVFAGLWVFVPRQDFGRSDRRPYLTDRGRVRDLYLRSNDRTHYVRDRDSDRIVDRSIDTDALEQSTHRRFGAQAGAPFLRQDLPRPSVTEGQDITRRMRGGDRRPAPLAGDTAPEAPLQNGPSEKGPGEGATASNGPPAIPERLQRRFSGLPRRGVTPQNSAEQRPGLANPASSNFGPQILGQQEPAQIDPAQRSFAPGAPDASAPYRRGRYRGAAPNIPSTDHVGVAPPPNAVISVPAPDSPPNFNPAMSGPFRAHLRGLAPAAASPTLAVPNLSVAAPLPTGPAMQGLQAAPGLQQPAAPTAVAQPAAPLAAAPLDVSPAQQGGVRFGRGLHGFSRLPGAQ